MNPIVLPIDMSNVKSRTALLKVLNTLHGPHKVTITQVRRIRSLAQNNFYWGVVIPAFRNYLLSQGSIYSTETLHEMLKERFLKEPISDRHGEIIGYRV